ncbi:MAG: chromosome segregation protein SMC [Planctomycetes bacterium]|nr:chromosome segregation protein SMC [Planctomycetota bacterium]
MKLSRLQLRGFKSFANQTEFSFVDGLTGVVGPNGCGKSNIVDSFKWVLGDRSAKSMRGEEMLDVIFNGGNGNSPAGMAEVSLSFSNADKTLPMDYDEITITRRLYRSGESEYLINNQTCRLKDIRELFMDTGVGMESYSIIEQGGVDFVLKATPVERRGLFEEAAGISKYKARRKEAEGKLEKAQQDLLRLNDVTREIKREIRSIKIMATKAQKYKEMAEEMKRKKASLFLHQYHTVVTKHNEITQIISGLTGEVNSLKVQIAPLQETIINLEKNIITVENTIKSEQESLLNVSSQISALSTEIEHNTKRCEELKEEETRAKEELAALTGQAIATRQTICETMHLLETAKQEAEALSNQLLEQNNLLEQIVKEEKTVHESLESKRNDVFSATHKKAQYQNDLTGMQAELKNLTQRREKCQSRQGEIGSELNKISETMASLDKEVSEVQANKESLKNENAQLEQLSKSLSDDLESIEKNIAQYQAEVHKKLSRKEILEDLEGHNQGLTSGVKAVLEAIKNNQSATPESAAAEPTLSACGILADIIKVDPKYVTAIEAALGEYTQAIVTKTTADSLRIIDFVKKNRKEKVITISLESINNNFNLNPSLPSLPGVLGKVSQVVRAEKEFESIVEWLLGSYILAENLDTARVIAGNNQPFRPVVTMEGETITAEGIISGGVVESGISILSRKTELSALKDELKTISDNIILLEEQKASKAGEINELEGKKQRCRQSIYEHEIALLDKRKSQEEFQRRIELLGKEREINELELNETNAQVNNLAERATSTAEIIKDMEAHLVTLQAEMDALGHSINEYTEKKKTFSHAITELKVNISSTNERQESLNTSIGQLNNQVAQTEASLKNTSDGITECQAKIKALEESCVESGNKLNALNSEKAQIQAKLDDYTNQMGQLKASLAERKSDENKTTREIQEKEARLNELGLKEREYSLTLQNIRDKVTEETGNNIEELHQNYTDDQTINWEEINRQVFEMKEKMGTMVDVNLSSIDQLKELEERLALYDTQEQDLVKSKQSLQDLIRRMNRESREKMLEVFNKIQENFNTVFRKLFGGGRAELILCSPKYSESVANEGVDEHAEQTGAPKEANPENTATPPPQAPAEPVNPEDIERCDDILEAGVDIIAKPPGKEPTSIRLLSGGEKTMTALALMMAIFQLRPSPFCIMDESDAALDETNVGRFISLLKEYIATTQFIVISHNQKTMLTMDRLYGVTIETSGVSKKISVKMAGREKELEPAMA